jgi:small basic protein
VIWIVILSGFIAGIIAGLFFSVEIPAVYARYISIALLASFDTLIGGLKSYLKHEFDELIFVSGFIFNSILAVIISYLGDRLGIELYLAVIFVFGVRIFQNLAELRREFVVRYIRRK